MLNIIIKAIFFIIGKIGDIIILPIMVIVNTLVPNLSVSLDNIFSYLEMGFNYVPFVLKCFLIPSSCIEMVVIVFTAYYSFIISVRTYQFVMRVYNHFKP